MLLATLFAFFLFGTEVRESAGGIRLRKAFRPSAEGKRQIINTCVSRRDHYWSGILVLRFGLNCWSCMCVFVIGFIGVDFLFWRAFLGI